MCFLFSFINYKGPDTPQPDFFSSAQRSRMVHDILLRARYGEDHQQFGKLLSRQLGIIILRLTHKYKCMFMFWLLEETDC